MNFTRLDAPGGSGATFLIGTDSQDLAADLRRKAGSTTPTPGRGEGGVDGGGPITRFTDAFSRLGTGTLERVGLSGHEVADAVQMRVNELYRNEFPVFKPRFEAKCKHCNREFSEQTAECDSCGGETRRPDPAQKRRASQLFESVNKEGQSLRELGKALEWDQWLMGVPVLIIRYTYQLAGGSTGLADRGEVVSREVKDLVRGDPKRVVPVVDENRRIGGHWWACPRCRHDPNYEPAEQPGYCDTPGCHAKRREVFFAEYDDSGDVDDYYFREEVLTFPWAFPRLNGLDGLSPMHHVWLKQLLIEWQDSYAAAFYDPDSERLPNQLIVLHTTNADAWEERLTEARKNAKDDEYDSPVFANEYSPQDASTPEVQVVDAMPDGLLGQNESLKDTLKKDIRQALNIADVFDSDLGEAGGLNNEGLQIEVTDRSIASQMHDYEMGWLDTLAKRLGITDWRISFIPSTGPDAADLKEELQAGMLAEQAGLDASLADERVDVADGDFERPEQPLDGETDPFANPSAGGGGFQSASGTDASSHDHGPTLDKAGPDQIGTATEVLFDAHRHMVWPDLVDQKASEPFWSQDEDMPQFVKGLVREALRSGAITQISKRLPTGVTRSDVRSFFEEKLAQPQGWSLRSLTEDYADRFDVTKDIAATAVRRQTKSALDTAREIGFERQGNLDERRFKWVGPIDDRKTDASWEVLEKTNPDHGGTPRPLDELQQIVAKARRKHFPKLTGAKWADSWQDRDTYVEHFE